jgi:Fe-S-cluster containining protein
MPFRFECRKCGKCCKNIRGRFHGEVPKISPILFMAVTPSLMTISLFEWELLALKSKAAQLALCFKVKPNLMFWDEMSSTPLILTWELDHDDCPFLSKNNLCMVQEQKPLLCQTYPLSGSGFLADTENQPMMLRVDYGDCPNLTNLPSTGVSKPQTTLYSTKFRELFESYGSIFVGSLRFEGVRVLLTDSLKEFSKRNLIHPAIVNKSVMKAILRNRPVGFLEYLRKRHPQIAFGLEEGIRSIYELDVSALKDIIDGDIQ